MVERVGLSYPTIYRMEQRKLFPAPIKIVPVETWADEPVAAE
jgi:predicted DNA-binding transcriptional regulator AlpA